MYTQEDRVFLRRFAEYLWFRELIDDESLEIMTNNIENYIQGEEYYKEAQEIFDKEEY